MKIINILGSRVVKTGVAVFLTALICLQFNWSPVFAVITAIVTLEPTVADSIKKGIVRFPASVIGSGYAVALIALFGNSPITYTLAAVLTITTCYKLNLHAGLLVATLTAVTMVEVIDSNYLIAFLTRLGTTSIGLLVSTSVNLFVLPPDYTENIVKNINKIKRQVGNNLETAFSLIIAKDNNEKSLFIKNMDAVRRKIHKTEQLIRFQKDEAKFHPLLASEKQQFLQAENQLSLLRTLHYHLDNLKRIDLNNISWTTEEKEIVLQAVNKLSSRLKAKQLLDHETYNEQMNNITKVFWEENKLIVNDNKIKAATIPAKLIVLYELVAMYNIVKLLYKEK